MGTTCKALASPRPLPSKLPHCLLPDFISCFSPSQCLKQPDMSPELLLFSLILKHSTKQPGQCWEHACSLTRHIQLFATPWTVARQAPLSMGFSRQEYQSGLPFPPPGDLPNPGIKRMSPVLAGGFCITELPEKPTKYLFIRLWHMGSSSLTRDRTWALLHQEYKDPSFGPPGKSLGQRSLACYGPWGLKELNTT